MHFFIRKAFLALFLVFGFIAQAQPAGDVIINDTLNLELRNSRVQENYYDDAQFDYTRDSGEEPLTFWQKLQYWFFQLVNFIFNKPVLETLFYILVFGLLAFLIIRLLGYRYSGFWLKKKSIPGLAGETYDESIIRKDFDREIQAALENRNFKAALRFQYLKLLQEFAEKGVINWEPEKTNREYQQEIERRGFGPAFKKLTGVYEYVWYGDFDIGEDAYARTADDFEILRMNLND